MRTLSQIELKRLQAEWYEKLKQTGFKDIEEESESMSCTKMLGQSFHGQTLVGIESKAQYFKIMSAILENPKTKFRNQVDEYILKRHCEGALIKMIVDELAQRGTPKERKTIRIIIRRYEMEWHVRSYTDRQLNRKPKRT